MLSAWAHTGCHIPCNHATLLRTKLRQLQEVTISTEWLSYQVATKTCLASSSLVRYKPLADANIISDIIFRPVGRLNRPGIMVYGGTIRAGSCDGMPQIDIVSAFQSYGKFLQDGKTPEAEQFRYNTVRHACPGPGACGGVSLIVILTSPPQPQPLTLSIFPLITIIHRIFRLRFKHKLTIVVSTHVLDVYRQYDGLRCGGPWHDPAWLLLFPGRVSRQAH